MKKPQLFWTFDAACRVVPVQVLAAPTRRYAHMVLVQSTLTGERFHRRRRELFVLRSEAERAAVVAALA